MGLQECAHGHEGQHSHGERTSMLFVGSAVSRLAVISVKLHHSCPLYFMSGLPFCTIGSPGLPYMGRLIAQVPASQALLQCLRRISASVSATRTDRSGLRRSACLLANQRIHLCL